MRRIPKLARPLVEVLLKLLIRLIRMRPFDCLGNLPGGAEEVLMAWR